MTDILPPVDAPTEPTTAPVERPSLRARTSGSLRLGVPFALVHLSCLAVLIVGWSPIAVAICVTMYVARLFGITGFYHRYFSHRAFSVTRPVQFAGAVLGAAAAQRGPLWWAAHHRRHHRYTDRAGDPHSPVRDGLLSSHLFWIFAPGNHDTNLEMVEDLAAFPELRFIDRFHHVVPALTMGSMFLLGYGLGHLWPGLHTSGPQMLVWGFSISTVLLYHATFSINSLAHRFGTRRYDTKDASRNNWSLALLTMGEGWHNNHHRFPGAARQGFAVWELDVTWIGLRILAKLHLVRDLRPVPPHIMSVAAPRRPAPASI
jgi:stearoyl-CoA desaturase (Delta-9 desaturase)